MDLYDVREHTEFEHIEIPALDELPDADEEPGTARAAANATGDRKPGGSRCRRPGALAWPGAC